MFILKILGIALLTIVLLPILFIVAIFYFIHSCIMHICQRVVIRKHLKPVIKEARYFYHTDLIENDHFVFFKNNSFTSVKIPCGLKGIKTAINKFKRKSGVLSSNYIADFGTKASALSLFKKKQNNIFFSTVYKDKYFKKVVHLYDLNHLDEQEIASILSMKISDKQKFLILKRYYDTN